MGRREHFEVGAGMGTGSWVTSEGEKIIVPEGKEHVDLVPGGHGVRRYMKETHHARVRSVNGQMNVMIAHPLTGKQKERLLTDADRYQRFSVGITTSDGPSSFIHYEEGDASEAKRMLTRAHNRIRQNLSDSRSSQHG